MDNSWVESYLNCILSSGLSKEYLQRPSQASDLPDSDRDIYAHYYVQQVMNTDEEGIVSAWQKAQARLRDRSAGAAARRTRAGHLGPPAARCGARDRGRRGAQAQQRAQRRVAARRWPSPRLARPPRGASDCNGAAGPCRVRGAQQLTASSAGRRRGQA